jgi:hypothetical protein
MSPTCALAFGDLDGGVWGAAWTASVGEPQSASAGEPWSVPVDLPLSIAVRAGADAEVLAARLTGGAPDQRWRVHGDSIELVLSPSVHPAGDGQPPAQPAGQGAPDALRGFDQLCRASGRVTLGESEVEVDAPGWRSARDGQLELDRIDSFRQVAAWFGREDGFALVALRPRSARGQDADLIAASVLDPAHVPAIDDPRLSTTYGAAGVPARAGVELWFAAREAEDSGGQGEDSGGDGEPEALPRRAAGEAAAPSLEWETAGFALQAVPLRWHSGGEDGAGVYLLGRRA